jgi:hypothetical protein
MKGEIKHWFLTVPNEISDDEVKDFVTEAGGHIEDHPTVPMGKSQRIFFVNGPKSMAHTLKALRDDFEVHLNSDFDLY